MEAISSSCLRRMITESDSSRAASDCASCSCSAALAPAVGLGEIS